MVSSIAYYITLLRRDFAGYCSRELGKLGLSQGLLFFILYVGRPPGCTPGQLAAALHMAAPPPPAGPARPNAGADRPGPGGL